MVSRRVNLWYTLNHDCTLAGTFAARCVQSNKCYGKTVPGIERNNDIY
jgi:hypothetical protein